MKLIPNKKYNLRCTGNFCHIATVRGEYIHHSKVSNFNPYTFVGSIDTPSGFNNIFMSSYDDIATYAMYGCEDVEDYATPVKTKIKLSDIAEKFGIDINEIEVDND